MLNPRDRGLLLESLRPPVGYELDCAIGTTYSLDLMALLTVPLAFTLFDWEDKEGRPLADPLAVLESLRRYADHITIFCQAGQIKVPPRDQLLLTYLERSIVEVAPPNSSGVFHPKVWLLRWRVPGAPVLYRVLCLTRNLTFDRSWDTLLVLDGELIDRKNAFGSNHPLGDFIAALPQLAVRQPLPERIRATVDRVQNEVRRVRFEAPEGFEEMRFWALGIPGASRWPFRGRIDRMLVISPFVSAPCLRRLTEEGTGHVLVSRTESLEPLDPACLRPFGRVYVLNDGANAEALEDDGEATEGSSASDTSPIGLHAKLYVADAGWDARVWAGSANATDAGFEHNVEFLVELRGKKSRCGVDAFLGHSEESPRFVDLLQEFSLPSEPTAVDAAKQRLDHLLEDTRRVLAMAGFVVTAVAADDARQFHLRLHGTAGRTCDLPPGVAACCWPVTLRENAAVPIPGGTEAAADFGLVSFEAVTSFIAFRLTATDGILSASTRFVLNLPLDGVPTDRQERILRSLLHDRQKVLRFLLLLLSGGGLGAVAPLVAPVTGAAGGPAGIRNGPEQALFESLVRAIDRNPAKLDQIARLVEDLRKTPEGCQLLPEGFDAVWEPIWAARQALAR